MSIAARKIEETFMMSSSFFVMWPFDDDEETMFLPSGFLISGVL
jgi:hypothetical protein